MKANKKTLIKYGVIVLIIGLLIIGGIFLTKKDASDGKTIETMNNETGLDLVYDIVVEIKGEIKYPGIYTLPKDTRVQDLIVVAGGLTNDADDSALNKAQKLVDGMVVIVPRKTSNEQTPQNKVNINTAGIEELCTLSGIGEATAQKIIDYRLINGNFSSIEEIKNVSGIGESLFNKIKDNITI